MLKGIKVILGNPDQNSLNYLNTLSNLKSRREIDDYTVIGLGLTWYLENSSMLDWKFHNVKFPLISTIYGVFNTNSQKILKENTVICVDDQDLDSVISAIYIWLDHYHQFRGDLPRGVGTNKDVSPFWILLELEDKLTELKELDSGEIYDLIRKNYESQEDIEAMFLEVLDRLV